MKLTVLPVSYTGDPVALAMLQAFYSRSLEPVSDRINRLGGDMASVRRALNTYYVGYGHNSIADCGFVTFFIEGVSILAAKAIQDHPLYNGQECSTRYIELGDDGYVKDRNHPAYWWQAEYARVLAALIPAVQAAHPFEEPEGFDVNNPEHTKARSSYAIWKNATQARAFDVARAWIPTNALTNLSLTCSLRTANELVVQLQASMLPEIQEIGNELSRALETHYPDACSHDDTDTTQLDWLTSLNIEATQHGWQPTDNQEQCWTDVDYNIVGQRACGLSVELVNTLNQRPRHGRLPIWLDPYATFTITGYMDYGTWRDLQRHRRNIGRPTELIPTTMHSWYTDQLVSYLGSAATPFLERIAEQYKRQAAVWSDTAEDQYSLPLGNVVHYHYTLGLAQAVYFAELRSGNTVHPILRPLAQSLARCVNECTGVRVDYDSKPARFDVRRGQQTIVENAPLFWSLF